MPGFQFLHDSLRDYFCAEGLCEAGAAQLADLADDYATWGQVMHVLPDLLDASGFHDLLSHNALVDWQHNDFALDCLPRLYWRRGRVDDLLSLVRDVQFQTRKRKKQHLCYYPLLEDVQCALEEAIKGFCGKPDGSINYSYLPEVVRFALLRPWVRISHAEAGPSVVGLASEGNYVQAMRLAQLMGADTPEAAYYLLLLCAWIAVRKAGDVFLGQGRTAEYMVHCRGAQKAVDEALRIDARWCRLSRDKWDTELIWWEAFLLDLARALLDEDLEAQAIAVIQRFSETEHPDSMLEDPAESRRWDLYASERRPAAASFYLLTASQHPRGAVHTHLVERAEELARALPPKGAAAESRIPASWVELVRVAVAYASVGAADKAGRLYGELLEQWIVGYQDPTPEQPHEENQAIPTSIVRQINVLDVLLTGLRHMEPATWMRDWCVRLMDTATGLSTPWCPVALRLRVAEACILCGEPERPQELLVSVIGDLSDKAAPDTPAEAIVRASQILQKLGRPWQKQHLASLIDTAIRCLDEVTHRIDSAVEEPERFDAHENDQYFDELHHFDEFKRLHVELPSLWNELRQCAQSACALLQIARGCMAQDYAQRTAAPAIQKISQLPIRSLTDTLDRSQAMLLLEMAIEVWEMDEIDLAKQALAPVEANIATAFSQYGWEYDQEGWTDVFKAWRGRCPKLWTAYENIQDIRIMALSTEQWPPRTIEEILQRFPRRDIAEFFESRAWRARHEILKRLSDQYTGRFLLALLNGLGSGGEHRAAAGIYPWLLNGFMGLQVPETTLVEALKEAAFDADFQTEIARKAEEKPEKCYPLAVMAHTLLRDEKRRNQGFALLRRLVTCLDSAEFWDQASGRELHGETLEELVGSFRAGGWDEAVARELLEIADDAQERGEKDFVGRTLRMVQRYSERSRDNLANFRPQSFVSRIMERFARDRGKLTSRQWAVLSGVAGRMSRQGWSKEGQKLFARILQALPEYDSIALHAEVAKELWLSNHEQARVKAEEMIEAILSTIQHGLEQLRDPASEDPLSEITVDRIDITDVNAVADALSEMEEPERRRDLLERAADYFARAGISRIPDAVSTLAKLGRLADAQQLVEEKLSKDDAKLAEVYLGLAGTLSSVENEITRDKIAGDWLFTIQDRKGTQWTVDSGQWTLVKGSLWGVRGSDERPRQLAALLRFPESGEWTVTESLLADLITMGGTGGKPVVPTPVLLDIYQVCQSLAGLSIDTGDTPE